MSELRLERVSKVFSTGVQAVSAMELTVASGELMTLVGPSGCGKTTTLRLIAGLEQPTSGTIRLDGADVTHWPPRDRDAALVFQRHNLYPHLNVRRNLSFGMDLRRGLWRNLVSGWIPGARARLGGNDADIAARIAEAAKLLELGDVLDRRPDQLSGGQQQRVALGRALVRRPALWLLDEPLSHLDPHLRAELRRQLHLLHRRLNATMIYVTHDQLEAMTLGERLVVMDQGRVQQAGPPETVYARPRNRFVAGFVGWPSMSFLDGQLAMGENEASFVGNECRAAIPLAYLPESLRNGMPATTLGIRPDNVRLVRESKTALAMEIALVEHLGSELLVTGRRGSWVLTMRCPLPAPGTVGDSIYVDLDMSKAHWFDQATGLAFERKDPAL